MLPGLSEQMSRPRIPGEWKAAPPSMEMRTLWESAFALFRITETLLCLFHLVSTFYGHVCSSWRVFPSLGSPQCFLFLGIVSQDYLPDKLEEDFQRVAQKYCLCWRLCTTLGSKLRGGLGKRADIENTVTCFSSQPGCIRFFRKKSWGWG